MAGGMVPPGLSKGLAMNFPKIDIAALPGLDTLTGVFGSIASTVQSADSDDNTVLIMTYLYEVLGG